MVLRKTAVLFDSRTSLPQTKDNTGQTKLILYLSMNPVFHCFVMYILSFQDCLFLVHDEVTNTSNELVSILIEGNSFRNYWKTTRTVGNSEGLKEFLY
jgi:hypothetical protein